VGAGTITACGRDTQGRTKIAGLRIGDHAGRGDLDGAIELYRRSLELGRGLVAPDNPVLAGPLLGLGELLMRKGDPAAAEPVLREAYELCLRGLPVDSPLVAEAALALDRCQESLGRTEGGATPAGGD
jgi:hypothetical protein